MIATLLVGILAAVVGAFGGAWLVERRLAEFLENGRAAAKRANVSAVRVERLVSEWPDVLARLEAFDDQTTKAHLELVRFITRTQAAERQAAETAARMQELEQAVAATFSIQLTQQKG